MPPLRVTRPISRSPATGSVMKWTTSCARAAAKESSAKGSCSAGARRTSTPGFRSRAAATKLSDGSTAATASAPSRRTSSPVSAPGPQPTSRARTPGPTPAKSASSGASGSEYLPMKRSYDSAGTAKLMRQIYVDRDKPRAAGFPPSPPPRRSWGEIAHRTQQSANSDQGPRFALRRVRVCLHAPGMSDFRIGIGIWDGVEELDFAGPYEVLTAWARQNDERSITVETISSDDVPVTCAHGLRVIPDTSWGNGER